MLKAMYAAFRFLYELLTLGVYGWWGWQLRQLGIARFAIMLAAPLLVMLVWGTWGSPMAAFRLQGIPKLLLELAIYSLAALLLFQTGRIKAAAAFLLVGVANALVNHIAGWGI